MWFPVRTKREEGLHERQPVFEASVPQIDFGFPSGPAVFPTRRISLSDIRLKLRGKFKFRAGQHRFVLQTSRPARVFVDDVGVIDGWSQHVNLTAGRHRRAGMGHGWSMVYSGAKMPQHVILLNLTAGDHTIIVHFCSFPSARRPLALRLRWLADDFGLKVYVYDLPPRFNMDLVKVEEEPWREKCRSGIFAPEYTIHQALLDSTVRVLDPWVADVFYVPVYGACDYRDGRKLVEQAVTHIQRQHHFFSRHQGRDHVFAATHDFGACFEFHRDKAEEQGVVLAIRNSMILSILGDTNSVCFRADRDIVVPPMPAKASFVVSIVKADEAAVITGAAFPNTPRDINLFFQGRLSWKVNGFVVSGYSHGVRRAIHSMYAKDPWFHIIEGSSDEYASLMLRAKFCLCPLGWALWSPRIAESILAGCVPVIIADTIRLPFDWELEWPSFSVKISEEDVRDGKLKSILMAIPDATLESKQQALVGVRAAMAYASLETSKSSPNRTLPPTAVVHMLRELRAHVHQPQEYASARHSSDYPSWT